MSFPESSWGFPLVVSFARSLGKTKLAGNQRTRSLHFASYFVCSPLPHRPENARLTTLLGEARLPRSSGGIARVTLLAHETGEFGG